MPTDNQGLEIMIIITVNLFLFGLKRVLACDTMKYNWRLIFVEELRKSTQRRINKIFFNKPRWHKNEKHILWGLRKYIVLENGNDKKWVILWIYMKIRSLDPASSVTEIYWEVQTLQRTNNLWNDIGEFRRVVVVVPLVGIQLIA